MTTNNKATKSKKTVADTDFLDDKQVQLQLAFIEGALNVEVTPGFDPKSGRVRLAFPDGEGGYLPYSFDMNQAHARGFIYGVYCLIHQAREQQRGLKGGPSIVEDPFVPGSWSIDEVCSGCGGPTALEQKD